MKVCQEKREYIFFLLRLIFQLNRNGNMSKILLLESLFVLIAFRKIFLAGRGRRFVIAAY